MISYFLKSGILLLIFYAVYKLWLETEKMFVFNRIYLLASLFFSFVIPLQLIAFTSAVPGKIGLVQLEELVIQKSNESLGIISFNDFVSILLAVIYALVVLGLTARFLLSLYSFNKRTRSSEVQFIKGEKIVLTEESILPHSFWKSIFINKEAFENGKIPSELIVHEKAHIKQKHTLDILFVEVLQIVFWFNPLLLFYKKAIKLNHEFLADEAVNKEFDSVKSYQNLLLDFASGKNTIALASNINYLVTKKRLLMMTKKESPIKIVLKVFSVGVIYALVSFTFGTKSIAQTKVASPKMSQKFAVTYDTTSVKKPEFPGGLTEFYKFVGNNFKMPVEASKSKVNGKVDLSFSVEKDGTLSDFKIEKDLGFGLGDEAIRVLKLSPKWIPGSKDGEAVKVSYSLPITIRAEK